MNPFDLCTKREISIIKLLATGYTVEEIAEKYSVTQKTVREWLKPTYDAFFDREDNKESNLTLLALAAIKYALVKPEEIKLNLMGLELEAA